MKHLYLALVCALVCSSAATAGNRFTARHNSRHTLAKMAKATAASTPIWRPATQTDYMYDNGEWIELGKVAFTYDIRGNAVFQDITFDEGFGQVTSTFDDYDQILSSVSTVSEDGTEWVNESKVTYAYDPVLHSYYTERMGYDWTDGTWTQNYRCETNDITRNADGNITEIIKSLPFGSTMIPGYKLVWQYDEASGRAVGMTYYVNYNPEPEWEVYDDVEYKNIVWAATDGQMTDEGIEAYVEGPNRISSCDAYYHDALDGHIFVTYTADGGYTVRQTSIDPDKAWVVFEKKITDANGSFVMTETDYYDENGFTTEPTFVETLTVKYNDKGDIVSSEDIITEADMTEIADAAQYEYAYDSEGRMTECAIKIYDLDLEDYVYSEKTVYGEYIDAVAGIEDVSVDAADAVYYDLNGRRVATPAPGHIYIKRQGTRVSKVVL